MRVFRMSCSFSIISSAIIKLDVACSRSPPERLCFVDLIRGLGSIEALTALKHKLRPQMCFFVR